jgi:AhpD family alkylhydroperoxidase
MMSGLRQKYWELSPKLLQGLRDVKSGLEQSTLGLPLIELVYLRIAQINGCSFCLNQHTKGLRAHNETDRRLAELAGWRVSTQFSAKERAALEWAESLTHVSTTHADDTSYEPLKQHFSDVEISDLTFAISLMNALTRLAIGMRHD